ncbi:hypothetical protein G9P44_001656 [Scheffersomyces stipitis]|nr:hypothetical protein G9P44_001656 [Scheffersomyces stipitis]
MSNLFTETFSSLTTFREWTEARNGNFIEPLISYFFTVDPQFCHQWGWFIDQTTDIRSGLIVLVLTYTFALLAFSLGILVLYGVGIFSDKEPKKGLKGINRQGAVQLAATQLFYAVIGTIVYYVNNYVNSMCVGY